MITNVHKYIRYIFVFLIALQSIGVVSASHSDFEHLETSHSYQNYINLLDTSTISLDDCCHGHFYAAQTSIISPSPVQITQKDWVYSFNDPRSVYLASLFRPPIYLSKL